MALTNIYNQKSSKCTAWVLFGWFGKLDDWQVGWLASLASWKVGESGNLDGWMVGESGELDDWRVGQLTSWTIHVYKGC